MDLRSMPIAQTFIREREQTLDRLDHQLARK